MNSPSSARPSFEAAAEIVDAPGAKWFTTPLNCAQSHPARSYPDMTSALNQFIAGATTVESCRSSAAETTQVLRAACRWRVSRSLRKCSLGATKRGESPVKLENLQVPAAAELRRAVRRYRTSVA